MSKEIENAELIQLLADAGFADLIDVMLTRSDVYTKTSMRLNKSSLCRIMGWKVKRLDDALDMCRTIIGEDILVKD